MVLQYKNTSVFFTDNGVGDTVTLLHGFLENASIWDSFIEDLAVKHRIICVDLLGHGQTGSLGYIHTMELMADAVHAVLSHLNVETCTLVGHSMGGYVALSFIEKYQKMVNGVLLVNSTSRNDSTEKKINRERAIIAVKHDYKTFIRIAIANLFNPETKNNFKHAIKAVTTEALKTPLQGIIAALEGMKIRKDRRALVKKFKGKKAIIISKNDPVLEYKFLLDEAKLTAMEVIEFPDGHMSFIENEALFFQNIMHFIEK